MVRRDAKEGLIPDGGGPAVACCACPAGASPVPVSVGALRGHFVVTCRNQRDCEEARGRIDHIMKRLGLELHAGKARVVGLMQGREGFDFLGCHLHKRMSGRLWQTKGSRKILPATPAQRARHEPHPRTRARGTIRYPAQSSLHKGAA